MANKVKIFVIDDDPWLREGLSNWLQEEGYEVWPIATGEEALQRLQNDEVDIIFTDLKMPGLGGMEVLKQTKALKPDVIVIMITAYGTIDNAVGAIKAGAYDYITKPFDMDEINAVTKRALEAKERAKQMEMVKKITQALTSNLNIAEIFEIIISEAKQLLNFDRASVALLEDNKDRLKIFALANPFETKLGQGDILPKDGSSVGWVVTYRKPLIYRDLREEGCFVDDAILLEERMRSLICVPLLAKGRAIGAFTLSSREPYSYTDRDLDILEQIAGQTAIAIENAKLFYETNRRATELATLNAITSVVNRSLDLDEILNDTLDKVLELGEFEGGGIHLIEAADNILLLKSQRGLSKELSSLWTELSLGQALPGLAFEREELLTIEDLLIDEALSHIALNKRAFRSIACIPIFSQDKLLGMMSIISQKPHHFLPQEIQLLKAIGDHMGIAIENAQLFESATKQLKQISSLQAVGTAIVSVLDIEDVLNLITQEAANLLSAEGGVLTLLNETKSWLEVVSTSALGDTFLKKRMSLENSLNGWVILHGQPQIFNEVLTDSRGEAEAVAEIGIRTAVIAPLVVKGQIIGSLAVLNKRGKDKRFKPEDQYLLSTFANQASIAIDNAHLYSSLQKANEELKTRAKAKTELINVISHQMSNLIMIIRSSSELLKNRKTREGELNERQLNFVDKIHDSAIKQNDFIENLLRLSRLEENMEELNLSSVSLDSVINRVASALSPVAEEREISLSIDIHSPLPSAIADEDKVYEILSNILSNALKFTEPGGKVTISAEYIGGSEVMIGVSDTGVGIPKQSLDKIFDKFTRAELPSSERIYKGAGLGLTIAKRLVEIQRGRIWAESEVDKGSTFYFTLPKYS